MKQVKFPDYKPTPWWKATREEFLKDTKALLAENPDLVNPTSAYGNCLYEGFDPEDGEEGADHYDERFNVNPNAATNCVVGAMMKWSDPKVEFTGQVIAASAEMEYVNNSYDGAISTLADTIQTYADGAGTYSPGPVPSNFDEDHRTQPRTWGAVLEILNEHEDALLGKVDLDKEDKGEDDDA